MVLLWLISMAAVVFCGWRWLAAEREVLELTRERDKLWNRIYLPDVLTEDSLAIDWSEVYDDEDL